MRALGGAEHRGHPAQQDGVSGAGRQPLPTQILPQTQPWGGLGFSPPSLPPQVLEAHRQGLRPALGYELNPWLLCLAKYRAWRAGCHGNVSFLKKDLWKVTAS